MTGECHISNLRQVCGDSFHALRCLGISGVEMKIYEWSLQVLPSLHRRPPLRLLSRAFRASTFHDILQIGSLLAGYEERSAELAIKLSHIQQARME